jgi:predicted MarR family transcription regulator
MSTSTKHIKDMLDSDNVDCGEILERVQRRQVGAPSQVFTRPISKMQGSAQPIHDAVVDAVLPESTPKNERWMTKGQRAAEMRDRRNRILHFIECYFAANFRPPTLREICAGSGVDSMSMITYYMRGLCAAGLVLDTGEHGESRRYVPAWLPDVINREMVRRAGGAA